MKWKSLSPDSKRRESPKFKQNSYYNHYYFNERSFENEHRPQYTDSFSISSNYDYPNSIEMRLKEMERRERELQRELEFYRNQHRPNTVETRDESEDELYFYGGGRKKQAKSSSSLSSQNRQEYQSSNVEQDYVDGVNEISELDDYDPADFESSSSWSSEEEDDSFDDKKSRKRPLKSVPTKITTNLPASDVKLKAYAPKLINLDAPTFMKLPPCPLPPTWANLVHNPLKLESNEECVEILSESVKEMSWLDHVAFDNSIQGILMRPPFDQDFTIKKWIKLMQKIISKVMDGGYLFIWVEREELADVLRAAEKYLSFKYVENLCWIRRDLGNKILKETPSKFSFFFKSKMTLLILRQDPYNACKLRHQRNPDCILDFVGTGRMPDGRVYDVIETLLDGTKFTGPHLMHLWAGNSPTDRLVYQSRKHWVRVLEISDEIRDLNGAELISNVNNDFSPEVPVQSSTEPQLMAKDDTAREGGTSSNISNPSTFDEDFCNFIICEPID